MIYKNNKTINEWYFNDAELIKVYKNGAICYYKMVLGETPHQEPCFAVVDDITQYSDTEFVDVYDKATEKWYKLNNLDQYEQYGVYGSGRTITYYEGKLTIDNGYEYEWDGSEWSSLGEVSGSSRVPIGYTEVEYVENTTSAYTETDFYPTQNTRVVAELQATDITNNPRMFGAGAWNDLGFICNIERLETPNPNKYYFKYGNTNTWYHTNVSADTNKHKFDLNKNEYYIDDVLAGTAATTSFTMTYHLGIFNAPNKPSGSGAFSIAETFKGKCYSFKVYDNDVLVRDLVPCINPSNVVGFYDVVNDTFYGSANNYAFVAGSTKIVYPKYYTEKDEPENNVVFEDMEEALAYECPWVGMRATIDGELYIFDSNNEWSKVPYYYRVEDVTTSAQGGSGWTISGSSTYNPDLDYYDDYSVYQESSTSQYKVAKVTIFGYDNFTYYLRSSGYSSDNYVVATNLDELQTDPTTMNYNDSRAITNTYNFNKAPASVVNLSNYRRITYNNLNKTVEHTFYVIFYGRYRNSVYGTATLLIPKDQTQENWEQVTFSASTNVGNAQKNLYIDGNNSTSGGTNIFFYRWMIGLPSGSHTSYTNYSNYSYCPSVTSSTFTSVAGGVRQVDYVYTNTTTKNLQFRLVDGSGNTITTGDTVYYNMTMGNGCGASTSYSNATFPSTRAVTVGGSFVFTNSSNRHYIYGYAPNIQFNTSYYSDNYNTYFDIPYTKLDTEAVTVTYTTYDPNDTEIPAFSTKITYPYNGGTTSSITLTSYDVPYTYPYVVSQTNTMFSADSQSFTAGQSSRTVTFTLYPNNRDFSTVADLEAYQYAWEGMVAYVDDTRYKYENGEWVEKAYALPDVPFILNYNAKDYDATNRRLPKTYGQSRNSDAVCNFGYHIVDHSADGYITVTGDTRMIISGTPYFNRTNTQTGCTMTIVSKARTTIANQSYSILTNRGSYGTMNWMWRYPQQGIFLHGSSSYNNPQYLVSTTGQPITASIRISYNGGVKQQLNDWTNNGSYSGDFQYGSDYNGNNAMFCDYATENAEFWKGDFYWIYMSFNVLTDEQIQQVIDYNENL